MESYQPIYDAVCSRISNGDIGEAVRDVAFRQFDISHSVAILQQEFCIAASEMQRPSAIYRPAISIDGNQWCALYGANLQDGVAGFGDSPDAAMRAFDAAWHERLSKKTAADCIEDIRSDIREIMAVK